jgi:hypothetical protein
MGERRRDEMLMSCEDAERSFSPRRPTDEPQGSPRYAEEEDTNAYVGNRRVIRVAFLCVSLRPLWFNFVAYPVEFFGPSMRRSMLRTAKRHANA